MRDEQPEVLVLWEDANLGGIGVEIQGDSWGEVITEILDSLTVDTSDDPHERRRMVAEQLSARREGVLLDTRTDEGMVRGLEESGLLTILPCRARPYAPEE